MSDTPRAPSIPARTSTEEPFQEVPERPSQASAHEARTLSVALFRRLTELREGTPEHAYVRNTLVELNLSLVKFAARRFRSRSEPMEDIVQVGTIGLIKAINRFDPDRGVEFVTFALPTITGEMKRFFRDTSWAVRVPRRLQELRLGAARTGDAMEQRMGHAPSEEELAAELGVTTERLAEARVAAEAYTARSLDSPQQPDEEDAVSGALSRSLGAEEEGFDRIEYVESLKPLMARLGERDRTMLALRFGQELTQAEIGARLGISQMHVSRLLSRVLRQLREGLLTDEPAAAETEAEGALEAAGAGATSARD
ncbi:SigB/SigF/SigG family RNA polymerase sigma factor [Streptomyces sp. NPDC097619]|uniref:SigB/SigF/SigG family RNA polymerase sigma factor n=1 Tax=Streptomyces sp. NPDC097619 TaxID=3157228 RepID=UPI00332F6717